MSYTFDEFSFFLLVEGEADVFSLFAIGQSLHEDRLVEEVAVVKTDLQPRTCNTTMHL